MQKSTDPSTKLLLNLLNICEEMLFSISLKSEILNKYESMRSTVFEKLNIPNDFSKHRSSQSKAQDQARQKKNFSDMEKKILKNTIEDQNNLLTKTLLIFSNFITNFKSSLEEAGTQDSDDIQKSSIAIDITTYAVELPKLESFLQHISSKQTLLQKQCKIQQDSLNSLSCENLKLKTAAEQLTKTYEDSIQVLEKKYQNKISQFSKNSFHEAKKINDLEMSFHEKESVLIDQLDKITVEDAGVLKDLREKLERAQSKSQELRTVLKAVSEKVNTIFSEFIDKEEIAEHFAQRKSEIFESRCGKTWGTFADLFVEVDFVGYALHKLKGDNDWLVEQLDAFCKENEELKERLEQIPKQKQMEKFFRSLNTNEVAVKDFNEARNKLVMQFKDSVSEFE